MAFRGRLLDPELNKLAACEIRLHHVQRHEAKDKSRAQKSVFSPEIAEAPHFRRQQATFTGLREVGNVAVQELNVLAEDGCGNWRPPRREKVPGRYDHDQPDRQQPFASELRRYARQGARYADGTAPVEYRFKHGSPCIKLEVERGRRESHLEGSHSVDERRPWNHTVDD